MSGKAHDINTEAPQIPKQPIQWPSYTLSLQLDSFVSVDLRDTWDHLSNKLIGVHLSDAYLLAQKLILPSRNSKDVCL